MYIYLLFLHTHSKALTGGYRNMKV